MTKLVLILAPLLISTAALGQDVKLSKRKENTRNGKAIYYVIKDQPSVKHGEYIIKAWTGNDILLEGEYDHGKRIGRWTERYYGNIYEGATKNTGIYEDDKKVGEWIYFGFKRDTVQIYDHTKHRMVYTKQVDKSEYVGGLTALNYELNQIISFPKELNTPGTDNFEIDTRVEIVLNSSNKVERINFSNPIGYGIEEDIRNWLKDDAKLWVAGDADKTLSVPLKRSMRF